MAIRGYLDALVKVGYVRLVQLSVRSRMTDILLGSLVDQGRVCEAADSLVDRSRHAEVVTYHEIALPLGPGDEQEWGKGDTATVVPFKSLHPAEVDAEYLRGVWRPDSIHAAAYRDWESIQAGPTSTPPRPRRTAGGPASRPWPGRSRMRYNPAA